jgi:hypothetical protein
VLPDDKDEGKLLKETSLAFTLRKRIYTGRDNTGEIDIENPDLWNLLKNLLRQWPYHTFQGDPITIDSPFEYLVFEWDKLRKAAVESSDNEVENQSRSDLKLLLDTIESGSGDEKLDKFFKTRQAYKDQRTVTFETLWTIFPPGTVVYGKPFQGEEQIFIVQDIIETWPPERGRKKASWIMMAWSYDWTGKVFERIPFELEFEQFDGQKPITSLPYYPFEFHEDCTGVKNRLKERGMQYRKICVAQSGARMFKYLGQAIYGSKGFSGDENVNVCVPQCAEMIYLQ